jgi:hypothetical protein
MFFNLKKNRKFLALKRYIIKAFFYRFSRKFVKAQKMGKSLKPFKLIQKRVVFRYARKFLFLFLKNKILKVY